MPETRTHHPATAREDALAHERLLAGAGDMDYDGEDPPPPVPDPPPPDYPGGGEGKDLPSPDENGR
jgi:hypothetical protein